MNDRERLEQARCFLKDRIRQEFDFSTTDQNRGISPPALEKPCPLDARCIPLPAPGSWKTIADCDVTHAIGRRQSYRHFKVSALCLEELAYLLWAVQGVRKRVNPAATLRTVPSAGARHALETYLAVFRVDELDPGIYRYLPLEHELVHVAQVADLPARLVNAALGQGFAGQAAVTFAWTAIPYRMEWRYGLAAHKVIALDAGHVCQNLYLACEVIGAGTCAIAAYDQDAMDRLLNVDGREEFTLYMAPVGKV